MATDCGGKKSAPVLVIVEVGRLQCSQVVEGLLDHNALYYFKLPNFQVRPPCHTGWSVVASQISYVPSTGPQPLFPQVNPTLVSNQKWLSMVVLESE